MSLLNDMLSDLNKKPPHHSTISPIPTAKRNWVKVGPNFFGWFTVILMACFLAVIVTPWIKPRVVEANLLVSVLTPIPSISTFNAQVLQEPLPELEPEPKRVAQQEDVPVITPHSIAENGHDEQLNRALQAIEIGEDSRAIELLTQLLKTFPASVEASENLAALYLAYAEFEKAGVVLDKALAIDSHHLRLTMIKSRLFVEQGKHRDALALLEKFNPDITQFPDYYALLAAIFNTLGRTNEAGSLYQALIRLDPTNGQYALGLAIALEQKQSFQQAIAAYRQASQNDRVQPAVRAYAENRLKILQG